MKRVYFTASIARNVGLTSATFGLAQSLIKQGLKVALIKPIAQNDDTASDPTFKAATLIGGNQPFAPIKLSYVQKQASLGKLDDVMEDIVAVFEHVSAQCDVVVIEGLSPCYAEPFVAEINLAICRTFDAEVVLVAGPVEGGCTKLETSLELMARTYDGRVIGVLINKVTDPACVKKLNALNLPGITQRGIVLYQENLDNSGQNLAEVMNHVAANIDGKWFREYSSVAREFRLSPAMFRYQLIEKSRKLNKRIVLPEGAEPRTIQAAIICSEKGIGNCVLLGNPAQIHAVAHSQGIEIPAGVEILDPDLVRERYVDPMVELRKGKGLTREGALKELQDTVVLGTMMLALDDVDGLVSGAVHTTANTIKPAFQLIKTMPDCKAVSSVFFMGLPEQVVVYGDCAVLPNPTPAELADIAILGAQTAATFGIPPRVAMLSYSTGTSGAGADVEMVAEATKIAQARRPDLLIDGPMQYDAATVESVGKSKAPNSKVAGRATVFVFPSLNVGNITYKAVQRSANVVSVGPMLQGLRKPVNDLSRGALVNDIVYTIALTAIQAGQVVSKSK